MEKKKEEKEPLKNELGTLVGFRELLRKQAAKKAKTPSPLLPPPTPQAPNMAMGGVPPMDDVMTSLNQTPPTNYDFYKDISSDDRAKLYQQLLQKQHTGAGNVVASGLAGLGDAISNSFGGQHNTYQKNVMDNAAANTNAQIGAMDTQRTQKLQDLQGNQEAMLSDPNSPISMSLREAANSMGLKVASGMPASVLIKVVPGFGDLANKQSMMSIQKGQADEAARHNRVSEGLTASNQETDTAEKGAKRRSDAAEGLQHRWAWQKLKEDAFGMESDETKEMKNQLKGDETPNHGVPDLGSTFNGGKVRKVTRVQ